MYVNVCELFGSDIFSGKQHDIIGIHSVFIASMLKSALSSTRNCVEKVCVASQVSTSFVREKPFMAKLASLAALSL